MASPSRLSVSAVGGLQIPGRARCTPRRKPHEETKPNCRVLETWSPLREEVAIRVGRVGLTVESQVCTSRPPLLSCNLLSRFHFLFSLYKICMYSNYLGGKTRYAAAYAAYPVAPPLRRRGRNGEGGEGGDVDGREKVEPWKKIRPSRMTSGVYWGA